MIWFFVILWAIGWALSSLVVFMLNALDEYNLKLDVGLARCFFWPLFVGYLIFKGSKKMFDPTV